MKNYYIIVQLCFILVLSIIFLSCIPSQPPQKDPDISSQGQTAVKESAPPKVTEKETPSANTPTTQQNSGQNIPSQPAPQKSRQTLSIGAPGKGIPYSVQITPLANEEGFAVQGSLGLSGTITRPEKDKDIWVFAGQFEFPSDKYKLVRIDYNIMNAPLSYLSGNKNLPPDFSAQVIILISLAIPPDAKDEKGDFKTPFKVEMTLPKKSEFVITMISET
ncbi:MAG: hypothetical protein N3G21_00290 [Candidatus Hydrogenedentes bacterium]|nr:hypothetical protein [Candidatus Hydrogenedentota bacterium]